MKETRREVNKDSIIFLFLLDTGPKVISESSELQIFEVSYKFLSSYSAHHFLFYIVPQSFLNQKLNKYF